MFKSPRAVIDGVTIWAKLPMPIKIGPTSSPPPLNFSILRAVLAASLGAATRVSQRAEAGAAGAAMMAAVANGHYASMTDCIAEWASPALGPSLAPDPQLAATYAAAFPTYLESRKALSPIWDDLAQRQDP